MSTIHSSWVPLGLRAAVRCGTARLRTVRSITVIMHGRARTATPSQARRDRIGVFIPRRRMSRRKFDMANQATRVESNSDKPGRRVAYWNVWSTAGSSGVAGIGGGGHDFEGGVLGFAGFEEVNGAQGDAGFFGQGALAEEFALADRRERLGFGGPGHVCARFTTSSIHDRYRLGPNCPSGSCPVFVLILSGIMLD